MFKLVLNFLSYLKKNYYYYCGKETENTRSNKTLHTKVQISVVQKKQDTHTTEHRPEEGRGTDTGHHVEAA